MTAGMDDGLKLVCHCNRPCDFGKRNLWRGAARECERSYYGSMRSAARPSLEGRPHSVGEIYDQGGSAFSFTAALNDSYTIDKTEDHAAAVPVRDNYVHGRCFLSCLHDNGRKEPCIERGLQNSTLSWSHNTIN